MSFLNYLNEQRIELEVEELLVESEILEEQLKSFTDLPNAWKKKIAYYNAGGENSKISTTNYKAKSEGQFNKSISDAFKSSDSVQLIIVSVFDQPFAMIYNTQYQHEAEKFQLITVDGSSITYKKTQQLGARHNYKSFVNEKSYFKVNAAKEKLKHEIFKYGQSILQDKDDVALSYDEVVKQLDINISVVHVDENRANKKQERKERSEGKNSSLTDNKKSVLRKFMKEVVTEIIEDIQKSTIKFDDVDTILDDIINGKNINTENLNADEVKGKINSLRTLLNDFGSAYREGKIMTPNYYNKAESAFYVRYLLDGIKKYKDKYDKE